MGINYKQLRNLVVVPTLKEMDMYGEVDVNLVMGTFAQESLMGTYIKQQGGGPGLGIAQVEPFTYNDLWNRFPQHFRHMKYFDKPDPTQLIWDLKLSTVVCRIKYYSIKSKLPESSIEGMAAYWKKWYNTPLGSGTEQSFIFNYNRFCK